MSLDVEETDEHAEAEYQEEVVEPESPEDLVVKGLCNIGRTADGLKQSFLTIDIQGKITTTTSERTGENSASGRSMSLRVRHFLKERFGTDFPQSFSSLNSIHERTNYHTPKRNKRIWFGQRGAHQQISTLAVLEAGTEQNQHFERPWELELCDFH